MSMLDDAQLLDLRNRGAALFTRPYNGLPVRVTPALAPLQIRAIVDLDTGEEVPHSSQLFNIFDRTHQGTALSLTRRLALIVDSQPTEAGLAAVLDAVEAELTTQNSDLVKYALAVFITQNRIGGSLYIPPVTEQSPEIFVPSPVPATPGLEPLGGLGAEARLDYFREDPDFNAHHIQWHRVYPAGGSENPDDPRGDPIAKDRQGELFWYMHQQMLARYDTDRIAVGLNPVVTFDDYRAAIPEGYLAEQNIADRFRGRQPNQRIAGLRFRLESGTTVDVTDLEANRERLAQAARSGEFVLNGQPAVALPPDTLGADLLGSTLEANIASTVLQGKEAEYFGLHNMGHGVFSALSPRPGGVMGDPAAAVRDPLFYRWHRHIDNLFVEWQEQLASNDPRVNAPPVVLRKDADGRSSDIGLALLRDIAPGVDDGAGFDGERFGRERFGGANWDTPLTNFVGPNGP